MKITTHIKENAFGNAVNYRHYAPATPSKDFLIFYHGQGECGASDGSQIHKVEVHGYPELAAAGFEFPFHIIAPQVTKSYSLLRKWFPAFVKLRYGAEAVIVTGLSMGGFAAFETPLFDNLGVVHAIAPVCGGMSASKALEYPLVGGWAFHGDSDTKVSYNRSKYFVDSYNRIHGEGSFGYTLYEGVGHNAWDRAYAADGELLTWLIGQFETAPKPVDIKKKLIAFINAL